MLPTDPFDTAELRRTVLDAWAASPARFREDANAEEDYALGGYRDRLVVELAQNAADAASRAGVAGRLRLSLAGGVLTAANTGAPLDADGVVALSTLRASAKRDGGTSGGGDTGATGGTGATGVAVGRFGVGFAATVAVSDAPSIASVTGAVRWSRDETRDLVAGIPALAGELAAREGHVPVLRLPFPSGDVPPEGFTTAVTLSLRDAGAIELTRRLLAETGPALLLALPALAEVTIETPDGTRRLVASREAAAGDAGGNEDAGDGDIVTVTVDGAASTWRTAAAGGRLDPVLLADRPAEERARTAWSVRWAVPLAPEGQSPPAGSLPPGTAAVVHAPTPTDEPLALPALLLASFPLSPDRRHVAPGPVTDFLVARAAETYAGLLPRLAPGPGLLDLVPGPVARGELDGQLRRAMLALLPETPFLPAADDGDPGSPDRHPDEPARLRPRDALLIEADLPGLAGFLAPVLAGLVAGPVRHPAYRALGVRRLSLAELTDTLGALDRPPSWWRGLYDALAAANPEQRAELGALPVPLADGRLVRGPRGLLLPGAGLEHPQRLAVLGLRVVHPDAASPGGGYPLLARLGAVEATPRSVLNDPATRAAVENSFEEEDPGPVADAILGLVAAADLEPGELPWLANLALPGDDGDWYPADELLLPGSALAEVVAGDAPFGVVSAEFAARHGADVLEKAGVLSTFGLLRAEDVDLGDPDLDVDGADDWADDVRARLRGGAGRRDSAGPDDDAGPRNSDVPPFAPEVLAVRDLDLVAPGRWPRALELLARPPLRAALTEPTRVLLGDGRYADVPSYTAWWLRRHLSVGGQRPAGLRAPDSDPLLAGLYDEAVPELATALADPEIARALGIRTSLAEVLAEPGGADDLLHRMADSARSVTRPQLRALWAALGTAPADVTPPDWVRAVRGTEVVVADADDALVLDAPDLWPLAASRPLILSPHDLALRLADLLDLPLASEEIAGAVESPGERRLVPEIVADLLPDSPAHYYAHDKLLVDGVAVPWRVRDGEVHAASPGGLARALAWAAGQWPLRHLLAALLTSPDDAARLLADADLDPG
ncbi:MAG TPA: hypothetical protein VF060_18310 [Trebonia sp.]